MIKSHNPYAKALDGLDIPNPVKSFFDFCIEREKIRKKREEGLPQPWTDDEIFKNARFLNVFREDDRGSKAILRFANNLNGDLETLIQALFFARWCNRQETLDYISSDILCNPEKLLYLMQEKGNWCNTTAYPVESIYWEGKKYSRVDAATILFFKIKRYLADIIQRSEGNIIRATKSVNEHFKMKNDFPIFMAITDIAWFRPDIINPASPVPTGIGAVAFLDRLQSYLGMDSHELTCEKMIELQKEYWPDAKRTFHPIDIEYLSCECRKYYSYINKTKLFKGKNIFIPKF